MMPEFAPRSHSPQRIKNEIVAPAEPPSTAARTRTLVCESLVQPEQLEHSGTGHHALDLENFLVVRHQTWRSMLQLSDWQDLVLLKVTSIVEIGDQEQVHEAAESGVLRHQDSLTEW